MSEWISVKGSELVWHQTTPVAPFDTVFVRHDGKVVWLTWPTKPPASPGEIQDKEGR